jgi:beta-lactamase superfamily II metal-dependent hydrolase
MMAILVLLLLLLPSGLLQAQSGKLDIYWIDAEGGASTLIVSPSGQALLIDTANRTPDDRDAKRIFSAAQMAGLKKIDYLLTTHFHGDHCGALPALAKMIPIEKYYDHGDSVELANARAAELFASYSAVTGGKRTTLKPGEKVPLRGVDITVVSSNGEVIDHPINGGGPNAALCANAQEKKVDNSENARSLGTLLTFGKFTFLNVGDLTWNKEMLLACPINKLGKVSVFQATHHGFFGGLSGPPPHVWAVAPQVIVVNNGPKKGLTTPDLAEILQKSPGVEGIWQGHLGMDVDKAHNTSEEMIANLTPTEGCEGHWIKLSATSDGKFTVTNGRNNFTKSYNPRK